METVSWVWQDPLVSSLPRGASTPTVALEDHFSDLYAALGDDDLEEDFDDDLDDLDDDDDFDDDDDDLDEDDDLEDDDDFDDEDFDA